MSEVTVRQTTVRVGADLERKAREHTGLYFLSFGALARVGLAMLAGYSQEDALQRWSIDPTTQRYAEVMSAIGQSDNAVDTQS